MHICGIACAEEAKYFYISPLVVYLAAFREKINSQSNNKNFTQREKFGGKAKNTIDRPVIAVSGFIVFIQFENEEERDLYTLKHCFVPLFFPVPLRKSTVKITKTSGYISVILAL
jgi:hypothetical protein